MTHTTQGANVRLEVFSSSQSEPERAADVDVGRDDEVDGEAQETDSSGGAGGAPSGDEPEELPKDVQFDILKNRRRRLVLRYLLDHETPVALGTLAEHVAAVENDKEVPALNSQERKRAYVGLYQCHLPRMADAGVIEFDKDRGRVDLGPHIGSIETYLEQESSTPQPWAPMYLSLVLFGFGGYLISQSSLVDVGGLGVVLIGLTMVAVVVAAVLDLRRYAGAD